MSEPEQRHIVNAFTFELSKVATVAIRRRMLGHLANNDRELCDRVEEGLGMPGEAERITPARPAIDGPREDDDKGWWRELVNRVLDQVAPGTAELDRDAFFEVAYSHFAEAGVWDLYPEVAAHAMRVTETAHWLEWQDWAAPILQRPYEIKNGLFHIPNVPGVGLEWDEQAVRAYEAYL